MPCILQLSNVRHPTEEPNLYDQIAATLSTLLLRTIVAIQYGTADTRSFWHGDLIRPLFQLLDDRILSDIDVFILSDIVLQCKHGKSFILDLEDALTGAFSESIAIRNEPDINMQDDVNVGSKRQSVQQSTNANCSQKRIKNATLSHSRIECGFTK